MQIKIERDGRAEFQQEQCYALAVFMDLVLPMELAYVELCDIPNVFLRFKDIYDGTTDGQTGNDFLQTCARRNIDRFSIEISYWKKR